MRYLPRPMQIGGVAPSEVSDGPHGLINTAITIGLIVPKPLSNVYVPRTSIGLLPSLD